MTLKINTTISDFSGLFRTPEYMFKSLSETGVDGIELGIGFKSRWTPTYFKKLSKKYNLPIVSLHQPLWAVTGLYFDAGFFKLAKKLGAQSITCHPLPKILLEDERMQRYFKKLSAIQKRIGIQVLVENLPARYNHPLLNRFFPPDTCTNSFMDLCAIAAAFDLGVTLDTDHLRLATPQDESWFETAIPKVRNIHLSSFTEDKHHMPLYLGDFDTQAFVRYLEKYRYSGQITLEVSTAKRGIVLRDYDFEAIKKSVEVVREMLT